MVGAQTVNFTLGKRKFEEKANFDEIIGGNRPHDSLLDERIHLQLKRFVVMEKEV